MTPRCGRREHPGEGDDVPQDLRVLAVADALEQLSRPLDVGEAEGDRPSRQGGHARAPPENPWAAYVRGGVRRKPHGLLEKTSRKHGSERTGARPGGSSHSLGSNGSIKTRSGDVPENPGGVDHPGPHGGQRARPLLSQREQAVLRLIADGLPNKQIATALGISPRTVKTHVTSAMNKLGVDNRAHAAVAAIQRRLL
jgi:DNA-binding CsgD family transcriptional regulator